MTISQITVDVRATIHWLNPSESIPEEHKRQQQQLALKIEAYRFQQNVCVDYDPINNRYSLRYKALEGEDG